MTDADVEADDTGSFIEDHINAIQKVGQGELAHCSSEAQCSKMDDNFLLKTARSTVFKSELTSTYYQQIS